MAEENTPLMFLMFLSSVAAGLFIGIAIVTFTGPDCEKARNLGAVYLDVANTTDSEGMPFGDLPQSEQIAAFAVAEFMECTR